MDNNSKPQTQPNAVQAFNIKLNFMDNTTSSEVIAFGFQTTERVLILAYGGEEERFPLCNIRSWYVKPILLRQTEPTPANSGVNSTIVKEPEQEVYKSVFDRS